MLVKKQTGLTQYIITKFKYMRFLKILQTIKFVQMMLVSSYSFYFGILLSMSVEKSLHFLVANS